MSRPRRLRWWSRRFRVLALDMGGVMIKLGQFLSARVDVLPNEITDELKGLQDEVPPEPGGRIIAVLQAELGDYHACFAAVEEEPLAAASLGQAHRAWLWPKEGRPGRRGSRQGAAPQYPENCAHRPVCPTGSGPLD